MGDWQAPLAKLVKHGARLSEPLCHCFEARPPSGRPWPDGLPSCPALLTFYRVCDGGRLGDFALDPVDELRPGPQNPKHAWLVLGRHDRGHTLIWDARPDDVALANFDRDLDRISSLGLTFAQFVEDLFFPSPEPNDEGTLLWIEALAELQDLEDSVPDDQTSRPGLR